MRYQRISNENGAITSDNRFQTDSVISIPVPSDFGHDVKNVTTAGTRVQLVSSSTPIQQVTIRAHSGNTGVIYVGKSAVTSSNGYQLPPGMADVIVIDDLNKIWIDAAVSSNGVSYHYTPDA